MRAIVLAGAIGVISMLLSPRLWACGGTFCDSPGAGQPAMPVDQTGENVLFVMSEGQVEAHVQIQYSGDPQRFAWVVPMPAEPTVTVGSQMLFLNLMNGSVPSYSLNTRIAFCPEAGSADDDSGGCSFVMGGASDDSEAGFAAGPGGNDNVETNADLVTLRQSVGSFEVTVLKPTSAAELTSWLDDNGYLPDDEAPPIIDEYIAAGHVFVALKLSAGAGIDEIHPIVFRYAGTEPCVPLKLTRIAAVEDMNVRVFFLGPQRMAPLSYKQVTFNPLHLDWMQVGQNYADLVGRAIDSPIADGRAFVTEYAGPSSVVSTQSIHDNRWSSDIFNELEPVDVVATLNQQGLMSCTTATNCTAAHPLVFPLLRRYLPVPAGFTEGDFYSCPSCIEDRIDPSLWDGAAFAGELEELVIAPGSEALAVLARSPYLTRLLTRISPAEMLEDPTFQQLDRGILADVTAQRQALQTSDCSGNTQLSLPDGRTIQLEQSFQQPAFDELPTAEMIEEFTADGNRVILIDNRAEIDLGLQNWNDQHPPKTAQPAANTAQPAAAQSADDSGGCALGHRGLSRPAHVSILALILAGLLRRGLRIDRRLRRS